MDSMFNNVWDFPSISDVFFTWGLYSSSSGISDNISDKETRELYSSSRAIWGRDEIYFHSRRFMYGCPLSRIPAPFVQRVARITRMIPDARWPPPVRLADRAIDISLHSVPRALPKYIGNFPIRMPKIPRVEPSLALFVRQMRGWLSPPRPPPFGARMWIGRAQSSSLNAIAALYSELLKLFGTATLKRHWVSLSGIPDRIELIVFPRLY